MKKLLFVLLFIVAIKIAEAQNNLPKIDSVCSLIKKYFNKKDATGLYALTGSAFKKAITLEKFIEIGNSNLFPLGEMLQAIYEKEQDGVSKYKVVFGTATLAMYLSLDNFNKLETFLFNEYVDERIRKTTRIRSDNKLLTALDKKVDLSVKPYMSLQATTGLSIGIIKNGKTYFYNYGEIEKGKNNLPNHKTIYEIGSISKTFTGILLAIAVNENKIKLNDPANKYLPATVPLLQFDEQPVIIKMLSNHSSAIPRMPGNFMSTVTDPLNPYKNYGSDQLFKYYATLKLDRKPGSSYDYSNLAVGTLGVILENIYKKTYEQLISEKITVPLLMKDTRQFILKTDSVRFAKGYNETGKYNGPWDFRSLAAAGAIRSTSADMLRYARANFTSGSTTLNKAISMSHGITFSDGQNKTGLGWHWIKPGKDEVLFHNGGTGGYRSYLVINKKKKFAVVILSNTAIGTEDVGNEIVKWLEKN